MTKAYALSFSLEFPWGVAISDGHQENHNSHARDLRGNPILRGSALAGALKSALPDRKFVEQYFGYLENGKPKPSRIRVPDILLHTGKTDLETRTFVKIDRNRGAAEDKALFSLESCPPGTSATGVLWLTPAKDVSEEGSMKILTSIGEVMTKGIFVGGHSARGLGFGFAPQGSLGLVEYDLADPDQWLSYQRDHRQWRLGGVLPAGKPLTPAPHAARRLRLDLKLTIPEGQDLLVADGRGDEHDLEVQWTTRTDEKKFWRLPGSTLRGVFRDWMVRLARREWGRDGGDKAIDDLFGRVDTNGQRDAAQKGRIFISDGLAPVSSGGESGDPRLQVRTHVAVNPISGGAVEHALFDNTVLVGDPSNSIEFPVTLIINEPREKEIQWLNDCLKALDAGIIRVGSSKAAGVLHVQSQEVIEEPARYQEDLERSPHQDNTPPESNPPANMTANMTASPPRGRVNVPEAALDQIEGQWVAHCRLANGGLFDIPLTTEKMRNWGLPQTIGFRFRCQAQNGVKISHVSALDPVPAPAPPVAAGGAPRPRTMDYSRLGESFTNPYSFIEFDSGGAFEERRSRTADDIQDDSTVSGYLDLKLETKRPMRTAGPKMGGEHAEYDLLTIGKNAVVPATGVKGALRNLLTILTGGPVNQIDKGIYVGRGRDVNLGPSANCPHVHLARVLAPPAGDNDLVVEIGDTALVAVTDLSKQIRNLDEYRPSPDNVRPQPRWCHLDNKPEKAGPPQLKTVIAVSDTKTPDCEWQLKLSGRPVNTRGKKEGAFKGNGKTLKLGPEIWKPFVSLYRYSDIKGDLQKGDLIWLETESPIESIESPSQIKSIQWARWGRSGMSMIGLLPDSVQPDWMRKDDKVAPVTNLFGRVDPDHQHPAFTGRIFPDNALFPLTGDNVMENVLLAPMGPPRPGFYPFYRQGTTEVITQESPFRGYKVYRIAKDGDEPWKYDVQPVFQNAGTSKEGRNKLNQTCDLLAPGSVGRVRLAFRSLTKVELGLLLFACELPWRLGGGKPLGLGLCKVTLEKLHNADGKDLAGQAEEFITTAKKAFPSLDGRGKKWILSQKPVEKLRYPRAIKGNQRGGHVWFNNLSAPKKNGRGMQAIQDTDFRGMILPDLDENDVLYGYDWKADSKR